MRAAHTRRMLGAATVAAVTMTLSACFIPSPPPVPGASNPDPIVAGSSDAADVREGFIPGDGVATLELQVDERSAVALTAASPDDDDLVLRLVGDGVNLENDDRLGEVDGFAFDTSSRDPLLGAVLEPGTYSIELREYNGDSTSFELQVLVGTTTVAAGDVAELELAPAEPAVVIASLETGLESIAATADFDTVLWVYAAGSDTNYNDDDSAGDQNPVVFLGEESGTEVVVVVSAYSPEDGGVVELSVE